jgi:taurine--2-oxoglutarate transaminase
VWFGSNGSDAVEASLKAVRRGTGRQGILAYSESYHGASAAATSVSGLAKCSSGFGELVPGTTFVPYPNCYRCPLGLSYPSCDVACAGLVEHAIQTQGPERIGAIIAEPISAVGGIVVPPKPYWRRVREIAQRYGAWLIFDEVVTGFGRCGSWFALEQYDVAPDVITLAKALTSGYQPLSAAVFNVHADDSLNSLPWYHGMSFQSHAVACAAALANIEILEREKLVERASRLGQLLEDRLRDLAERHISVGSVRGTGAMWGIELVQDRAAKRAFTPGEPFHDVRGSPANVATWADEQLFRECGVHVGSADNVLLIAPPFIFTEGDLDELINALSRILRRVDPHCV